jgi:hypothetical protein
MRRLSMAVLMSGLLTVMLSGVAAAGKYVDYYGWGYGPNQGEASKVVKLEGPDTCTCEPVPSKKYEGDFGKTVTIEGSAQLYGVTVKSGRDARFELVYQGCGRYDIQGDKDISNLVIWTCPCGPSVTGDYYIVK